MTPYDEELQDSIEKGRQTAGENADSEAYRVVFRALGKPAGYSLSPDLTSRILSRVAKQGTRETSMDFLWLALGILSLLVSLIIALFKAEVKLSFAFLRDTSPYAGILIFALVFIAFLNWLDHRLFRSNDMKWSDQ